MWLVVREVTKAAINFLSLISVTPHWWKLWSVSSCFYSPCLFLAPGTLVWCFSKYSKRHPCTSSAPSQLVPLPEWWSIGVINLHNGALNWAHHTQFSAASPYEGLSVSGNWRGDMHLPCWSIISPCRVKHLVGEYGFRNWIMQALIHE